MTTIYKYEVKLDDWFEVEVPRRSKVLSVGMQKGTPQMWVLVDLEPPPLPFSPTVMRRFRLVGTGNPVVGLFDDKFIGTFQLYEGALVFHLFEAGFQEVTA